MKLFYVIATRMYWENPIKKVVLTEEISSEYDSSSVDVELVFNEKPDLENHKIKVALFTAAEVETLMMIKNKAIPWGCEIKLKGTSVNTYSKMFDYVENVEIKELNVGF